LELIHANLNQLCPDIVFGPASGGNGNERECPALAQQIVAAAGAAAQATGASTSVMKGRIELDVVVTDKSGDAKTKLPHVIKSRRENQATGV
jgi:hypothetical protein